MWLLLGVSVAIVEFHGVLVHLVSLTLYPIFFWILFGLFEHFKCVLKRERSFPHMCTPQSNVFNQ